MTIEDNEKLTEKQIEEALLSMVGKPSDGVVLQTIVIDGVRYFRVAYVDDLNRPWTTRND